MPAFSPVWSKLPKTAAKLAVLEQAPFASLWVDEVGIVGYVNQRFSASMGYPADKLVGTSLVRVVPSLTDDYWQEAWWPLLENERHIPIFPLSWQHAKGIVLDFNASVSLTEVAGLMFAVFYLWPTRTEQESADTFRNRNTETLLHNLGESVCLLDELGVIRFANRAFCRLMAGTEASLIGVPILELITPNKSQLTKVWNVLQQKNSQTDCEFRNLAGHTLNIRMTVAPVADDTRSKSRYLVSFVDITEQVEIARKLEAQNDSFERLASNIPGFIYKFRMTPDGHYSFPYASRGCQEIFGVDPAKVVDDATPIVNTIHPDDLPMFQSSVLQSAIELSPWNFEARQKTSEGSWKWFHAASRPQLQDNGDIVWEGLVMDVTSRKKVEEELAAAKLIAEASASAKAEFLANMSHEIRTPLNAIIGLNRLVLNSELSPVQRDYLQKIQLSSENLLGIINNILDFSKIECGKLNIEHIEFNLDVVLENIGTMLEPVAAEKNLDLLIDRGMGVPLYMIGDSLRLIQVLTNLCSNAIKFTEHGEVIISAQPMPSDDGSYEQIRFSVKDTGIGLSEKQMRKIFEAFSQADNSTTRNYGGTGLGLTISKHLIELMGGEIGVNSIEGKGSEFYFNLPLLNNADIEAQTPSLGDLEGWHILLIMESESACGIFERMLHDLRFKVTVCFLGSMTLEEILNRHSAHGLAPHELILVDWKMSEGHKGNIMKALNARMFGADTPVVISISTMESESIKSLMAQFENVSFLNKPVTPSGLLDAIVNASGETSLLDSVREKKDSSNIDFYRQSVKGICVLVAEDNEINQEVVQKTLEHAGIVVEIANSGKEAFDRLAACSSETLFDAVLMDLQMPVMDGYEATIAIRRDSRFDAVPIIAMTAHTIDQDKQKCLAVGMQDHIGKPIDLEQMFAKLARWTHTRHPTVLNKIIGTVGPSKDASDRAEDTAAAETPMAMLTTVNFHSALHLMQGDEQALFRLLLKFAREQHAVSEQIRHNLVADDWSQASARAHQIKGVAGNLHINRVFEISAQLETSLKNRDKAIAGQLLDRLAVEIGRFCREIKQLEKTHVIAGAMENRALTDSEIEGTVPLLEQMIFYLENNNCRAEDCFEQVKLRLGGQYSEHLDRIGVYLLELDFAAAAEWVKKIREDLYTSL
ncbi:MAG: response regulator [Gammaproteobacteria bacterium]